MSRDKKADATMTGITVLGLAIIILLGDKVSSNVQGFILLFFIAAGYILAYHPNESKKIAEAFSIAIIEIISVLKRIILSLFK